MATSLEQDFQSWLSSKLKSLDTDEGVFGSYITGILTGDEGLDEKTEALEGILSEITASDISSHCHEILEHWKMSQTPPDDKSDTGPKEDVEEKLVRLLENNKLKTTVHKEHTEEEKRIKKAILQYSQASEDEEKSDEEYSGEKENGLEKNTNVQAVIQAQKEKREQSRLECQKKKEKDREDRCKQKQQQQEKKEKRKTQKGERKR